MTPSMNKIQNTPATPPPVTRGVMSELSNSCPRSRLPWLRGWCWCDGHVRRHGRRGWRRGRRGIGDGVHAERGGGAEDNRQPRGVRRAVLPLQVHHDVPHDGGEELRVLRGQLHAGCPSYGWMLCQVRPVGGTQSFSSWSARSAPSLRCSTIQPEGVMPRAAAR